MSAEASTAVVLGASMAGLMASAALARRFERVVVVERDRLLDGDRALGAPRKGVGQGRHNHNVSPRATRVLKGLFPTLLDRLRERGASVCDLGGEGRWVIQGRPIARVSMGETQILASRAELDRAALEELLTKPGVELRDATDVCGLTFDARQRRAAGARLVERQSGREEVLPADLVVDASGRGSRTPRWLVEAGYEAPAEENVELSVSYVTRLFRRRPEDLGGDRYLYVAAVPPKRARGSVAFAVEGERWMVLLFGYGERPPSDDEGFRAYAATLGVPELDALLDGGEALGEPATYEFARAVRRRYDRCRTLPRGLIVLGDALQSTNPSWGLGITSAAVQVQVLERQLERRSRGNVSDGYHVAAVRAAASIWDAAKMRDQSFDGVPGEPPAPARAFAWLLGKLFAGAEHDRTLASVALGLAGHVRSPTAVLRPDILLRLLLRSAAAPG